MKRNLTIVIAAMGIVWVIATGVFLFFAADLVPIPWLLVAFGAMDTAFGLALALLISTNTRVAWLVDPYAQTTDELLRNVVLLPDGRPYGRRGVDDRSIVERISEMVEQDAANRPPADTMPPWVVDMNRSHQVDHTVIAPTPEEES